MLNIFLQGHFWFLKNRPSGPILFISLNVHPCLRPFMCSLLRYRLNVFLAPLPTIRCPKLFWGISNLKKWSQIWKLLLIKGVKSLRCFLRGKFCLPPGLPSLGEFFLTEQDFLVSVLLSISVKRFFVSRMRDFCIKGRAWVWTPHPFWLKYENILYDYIMACVSTMWRL